FSRAGVAKSLIARSVFGIFDNANTFAIQLTKGTPEEALTGPLNFRLLKEGQFVHLTDGYLPEADFAFLDELFDGNDVALRSLLGMLHERRFEKGRQALNVPLLSSIATTNYLRESEVTEAVLDRFPFRSTILPSDNPYDQLRIDLLYEQQGGKPILIPKTMKVDIEEMRFLCDVVEGLDPKHRIKAPPAVLFFKNALIDLYLKIRAEEAKNVGAQEPYLSPRTLAKLRDVLNASALRDGRDTVSAADLKALYYAAPTIGQSNEENAFRSAYREIAKSLTQSSFQEVQRLYTIHRALEGLLADPSKRPELPLTWIETIKNLLHISSISEITCDRLIAAAKPIGNKTDKSEYVARFREGLVRRIAMSKKAIERHAQS
ncbi:MAG: AAA family ATPase, partial [Bdellovibrionales bacterium]|nr:AAA family ATPase [Bdellovibrionales bacterium]